MVFHKLTLSYFIISIVRPVVILRHRNLGMSKLLNHVFVMTHQRLINLCVLAGEIQIKRKIYL